MTQIQRLKDPEISDGNLIVAEDLDAEFNQLVSESNAQDVRLVSLESQNMNISGIKTFTGQIKTDTILEKTAGNGTLVNGVLCKSGVITAIPLQQPYVPNGNGQFGYDSTNHQYIGFRNGVLKDFMMTGDNFNYAGVNSISTATTILTTDSDFLMDVTSAVTLTFTTAATLGTQWTAYVRNSSSGVVTLTPATSDTINTASTLKMYPGECFKLLCKSGGFYTSGRGDGPVFLGHLTASSSTALTFSSMVGADFIGYIVRGYGITSTTAANIFCNITQGGVVQANATDYNTTVVGHRVGTTDTGGVATVGAAHIQLNPATVGTTAASALNFTLNIPNAGVAGINKIITGLCDMYNGTDFYTGDIRGVYKTNTNAIDGISFSSSAVGLLAGDIYLWGVRAS